MHETAIAHDLLRMCRQRMPERGARLERVHVAVGERSALDPDLLRFAFEAVVAESPDAGAVLEVDWRAIRAVCPRCGPLRTPVSGWLLPCPVCGAPLQLEGGDELDLLDFTWQSVAQGTEELA